MKTIRFEVIEIQESYGTAFNIVAVEIGTDRRTGELLKSSHRVNFAENGADFLSASEAQYFVDLMNDGLKYRRLFSEE